MVGELVILQCCKRCIVVNVQSPIQNKNLGHLGLEKHLGKRNKRPKGEGGWLTKGKGVYKKSKMYLNMPFLGIDDYRKANSPGRIWSPHEV